MCAERREVQKSESLIAIIKEYISQGDFADAEKDIADAMAQCPHDAQPHNLMGILMEHENEHCLAMRHFRAAWALDPSFCPARVNMEKYGSFGRNHPAKDAYDDGDCD